MPYCIAFYYVDIILVCSIMAEISFDHLVKVVFIAPPQLLFSFEVSICGGTVDISMPSRKTFHLAKTLKVTELVGVVGYKVDTTQILCSKQSTTETYLKMESWSEPLRLLSALLSIPQRQKWSLRVGVEGWRPGRDHRDRGNPSGWWFYHHAREVS